MAYGTLAAYKAAVPAGAFANVIDADLQGDLDTASEEADGYLAGAYRLPLQAHGKDLERNVYAIALWNRLGQKNYNPQSPSNAYRLRYEDALRWLALVRDGKIRPSGIMEAPDETESDTLAPVIVTREKRGW